MANLLVDSPPTLNTTDSYMLTPAAAAVFTAPNPDSADSPGWNFHDTYFVTIKAAKLAALGFNVGDVEGAAQRRRVAQLAGEAVSVPGGRGRSEPDARTCINNGNGTTTITFTQSLAVNDNSYGTGTDASWGSEDAHVQQPARQRQGAVRAQERERHRS